MPVIVVQPTNTLGTPVAEVDGDVVALRSKLRDA
jgi:hypothetical protein